MENKQIVAPSLDADVAELWIRSDFAGDHLNAVRLLLDMVGEECEWSINDAEESGMAQERILLLLRAVRNELDDAIDITTKLTTALQAMKTHMWERRA